MKNALIIEEQIYQKQKSQEQLHLSTPSLPLEQQQKLVLEDISPIWASRLKKENLPTFMSLNWWKWDNELHKASKCVVINVVVDALSITEFQFSPQFTAAVEAKVEAQQRALQAQNELRRIQIEAQQNEAQAIGEQKANIARAE